MLSLMNSVSLMVEGDLPTIAITQDMLKPIVDGIVSNVGIILIPAIAIFSILIGIKMIPRIISSFIK